MHILNALDDVIMLDEIMQAALLSVSDFKKHSYNTECQFLQEEFNSCKSKNITSLRPLIGEKIMKSCTKYCWIWTKFGTPKTYIQEKW